MRFSSIFSIWIIAYLGEVYCEIANLLFLSENPINILLPFYSAILSLVEGTCLFCDLMYLEKLTETGVLSLALTLIISCFFPSTGYRLLITCEVVGLAIEVLLSSPSLRCD